jgi:hypothetical protein
LLMMKFENDMFDLFRHPPDYPWAWRRGTPTPRGQTFPVAQHYFSRARSWAPITLISVMPPGAPAFYWELVNTSGLSLSRRCAILRKLNAPWLV